MKNWIINILMRVIKFKFILTGTPVIIQNSKGRILLGKRNKNTLFYPNTWGLPGGITNYGEKSIETAKREVKEELGIQIKITKRSKEIYEFLPKKECPIQSIEIVYYGKIIKGIPFPKNETQEVQWFNPSEIKEMKLAYDHKEILKKEGLI